MKRTIVSDINHCSRKLKVNKHFVEFQPRVHVAVWNMRDHDESISRLVSSKISSHPWQIIISEHSLWLQQKFYISRWHFVRRKEQFRWNWMWFCSRLLAAWTHPTVHDNNLRWFSDCDHWRSRLHTRPMHPTLRWIQGK